MSFSLGFVLAGEEHPAPRLVELGRAAEQEFDFLFLSDHLHPWNSLHGHSSYVWAVLGALAQQTRQIQMFTAVTCPLFRTHPTTLAQAVSTINALSEGRFTLGLGTGERLNEHVTGQAWPKHSQRLARLEEYLELLRRLLEGEEVSYEGDFYRVDRAQIFDAAKDLPIYLAASGPKAAKLAGRSGDGLICLGSRPELRGLCPEKPAIAQISVCWASSQDKAVETALRHFPEVALEGCLFAQLETPAEFMKASQATTAEDVAACIVCGPDPEPYVRLLQSCRDAGFSGVAIHQIGPNQEGFLEFWSSVLRPATRA